jgi:hypothetical protein
MGSFYERVRTNEIFWNIGPICRMGAAPKYRYELLLYAEGISTVRSAVYMAVNMNIVWDVTPCSAIDRYRTNVS